MATVNQTLSCTATAVPIVQKMPKKIHKATGTASLSLLKLPGKVLAQAAVSNPSIALIRTGIDMFEIVDASLKWLITDAEGLIVRGMKRFGIMVKGKPSGNWD